MELESWVPMGFTPAEAIVMATRDSAKAAKFNTGMVAAGKSADFIVLDANPLGAARYPRVVIDQQAVVRSRVDSLRPFRI
jgi:imidazolonepropionase-like amidohydrolase